MEAAAQALGAEPRRVFLTQGRSQLAAFASAPQHHYFVRAIDPPADIDALPLASADPGARTVPPRRRERADARRKIDVVVTKNSGGEATQAKLDAARDPRHPCRHDSSGPLGRPPRKRRGSRRFWPGSRLIGRPRSCAASAARARRAARQNRVSLEPISTSVLMSARPGRPRRGRSARSARRRGRRRARRRPACRGALQLPQQCERVVDARLAAPSRRDCRAR